MLFFKSSTILLISLLVLLVGCGDSPTDRNSTALSSENKPVMKSSLNALTSKLKKSKTRTDLSEAKKHWLKSSDLNSKSKEGNIVKEITKNTNIFAEFGLTYGGPSAYHFTNKDDTGSIWMSVVDLALDPNIGENPYYQNIKNFQPEQFSELQQYLSKSKYLVYWLPQGWDESWFSVDQIQMAMDKGMTPIFMYWYFGDHLAEAMPTHKEQDAYYKDSQKLGKFLKKLKGQKIVIMEPEFNKPPVMESKRTQRKFASTISRAIGKIKHYDGRDTLFSLCMLDTGHRGVNTTYNTCGYENCALGDKNAWGQTEYIYDRLSKKLDFISFQQMIGQFSRNPFDSGTWDNPNAKAYTEDELSVDLLAERINNFTKYLHEKHDKPILMPYITVASATWEDSNQNKKIENAELDLSGWEHKAEQVYEDLYLIRDELRSNGLFGYGPLSIFDNPSQDKGGYQYFLNNEYHLGIIKTGAKDEIDDKLHGDLYHKGNVLEYIYGSN